MLLIELVLKALVGFQPDYKGDYQINSHCVEECCFEGIGTDHRLVSAEVKESEHYVKGAWNQKEYQVAEMHSCPACVQDPHCEQVKNAKSSLEQ